MRGFFATLRMKTHFPAYSISAEELWMEYFAYSIHSALVMMRG
jgi:hypothetical protein